MAGQRGRRLAALQAPRSDKSRARQPPLAKYPDGVRAALSALATGAPLKVLIHLLATFTTSKWSIAPQVALARELELSQAAVSEALAKLIDARLIERREKHFGGRTYYRLAPCWEVLGSQTPPEHAPD